MKSNNPNYIPNELASAVVGGFVTSTEQIKDYKQNKSLESVNEEVQSNLQDHESRLQQVENLGQLTINGGNVQIATDYEDIVENSAKIPTTGLLAKLRRQILDNTITTYYCETLTNVSNKEITADFQNESAFKLVFTNGNNADNLTLNGLPFYYNNKRNGEIEANSILQVYLIDNIFYSIPFVTNISSDTNEFTENNTGILASVAGVKKKIDEELAIIKALIPEEVSLNNILADKNYVNESVIKGNAKFRGTSIIGLSEQLFLDWANGLNANVNDYIYWHIETNNRGTYKRYKYDGIEWKYEYSLSDTDFTESQWNTIDSGINLQLVEQFINKYDKPSGGIPDTDLTNSVQLSLEKADLAAPQITTYTKTEVDEAVNNAKTFANNYTKSQLAYVICNTIETNALKTIELANYVLITGGSLKIKFIYGNSVDNPTLNINETGPRNIFYNGKAVSSSNYWNAGDVLDVYYDGDAYQAYPINKEKTEINSFEYVDLGLPSGLLWAKYNVGASEEYEYGTKQQLSLNGHSLSINEDLANIGMGASWRLPILSEMLELLNNTTRVEATINNIHGAKYIASNGKYIFFPYAGKNTNTDLGVKEYILINTPNGTTLHYVLISGQLYQNGSSSESYSVRGVTKLADSSKVDKLVGSTVDNIPIISTNGTLVDSNTSLSQLASEIEAEQLRIYLGINEVQYVDLELPSKTLWATSNLENTYAWGATTPNGSAYTENVLDKEHDIANILLQGNWLIPTRKQIEELLNNTTVVSSNSNILVLQSTINNLTITLTNIWINEKNIKFNISNRTLESNSTATSVRPVLSFFPEMARQNNLNTLELEIGINSQYEAVDLGLPSGLLWSKVNIGAENELQKGNFYDYGKLTISQETTGEAYAGIENPLDKSVDAAYKTLGGLWHIPSKADFEELLASTTHSWQSNYNGVSGILFVGNGNKLFLPAISQKVYNQEVSADSLSRYRTSIPNGITETYVFAFDSVGNEFSSQSRSIGYVIRPVTYKLTEGKTDKVLDAVEGNFASFDAKGNLKDSGKKPTDFVTNISGKADKVVGATAGNFAELDLHGNLVDSGISHKEYDKLNSIVGNDEKFVDLGLPSKTLWRTCNVGANTEAGVGDYVGYSKTTPIPNDEDTEKYEYLSSLPNLTAKTDYASVTLGNNWHCPTQEQLTELVNNTTYSWETVNNVSGAKFTASNGNYIFIPAGGFKKHLSEQVGGVYLIVFTNDGKVHLNSSTFGYSLQCDSTGCSIVNSSSNVECAMNIRPVTTSLYNEKLNKPIGSVSGNFASFNNNGEVIDSGKKDSDYQPKLTSQTAYTSKGTALKVPQITTNSLGQVTNIQEIDIDMSSKANRSDAIGSLTLTMDSSTYVITLSGTKVDGTTFTVGDPIDLPIESVVVNGSYDSENKRVILTLKSGSQVAFSVADLINGLQTLIDSNNKLSADLVQDGTTNKVVTVTDKMNWNIRTNYDKQYLTIESLVDNNTIGWKAAKSTTKTISISTDFGNTWTLKTSSTGSGTTLATLNKGDRMFIKGSESAYGGDDGVMNYFTATGNFNVEGNILSLRYSDNFIGQTNLSEYGFCGLFYGNTYLINTKNLVLPSISLAQRCYQNMFSNCTSLTTAPKLPATTLAKNCYSYMFYGCTSLISAPELPATTLAQGCYEQMFYDCSSLTTAPELPANILVQYCYAYMFNGCTSLTDASELPATTLTTACYQSMFSGCTSLNYIKCLATDISASDCTSNWVENVAPSGTFIRANSATFWETGYNSKVHSGWRIYTEDEYSEVKNYELNKSAFDYSKQYLTFEALLDTTFTIYRGSFKYSLDNGKTWTTLAARTASPTVKAGDKIMWKQSEIIPGTSLDSEGIGHISSSGNYKAYGNIMSLLFGDNFVGKTSLDGLPYAFYGLFGSTESTNTKLMDISNLILPATILSNYSYYAMFARCASITKAPELPATTLANNCYASMFQGCTSLTTAPGLPATTLADYCYSRMFRDCTSFITAPALPSTTLTQYCYRGMFQGCTSLTTAPELPATTLATYCYYEMFINCTTLNYIKCLATNISASSCINNWVNGVAALGTFVKNDSMSDWTTGTSGIPSDWTAINNSDYKDVKKYELATVATSGSYNDLSNKPTIPVITGKADKVNNATSGNIAGLDTNGNLIDSGVASNQVVLSTNVRTIVTLTQAQYNALVTKDANTEYNII